MYPSKHHLQNIATWLVLLSFLLKGWPGLERFVLCISEDGRIAIEEAHEGFCGGKEDGCCEGGSHHPSDTGHGISRSSCGDCIDIPIMDICSIPLPSSSKFLYDKSLDPKAGYRCSTGLPENRSIPDRFESLLYSLADPSLESLRTIVLLI